MAWSYFTGFWSPSCRRRPPPLAFFPREIHLSRGWSHRRRPRKSPAFSGNRSSGMKMLWEIIPFELQTWLFSSNIPNVLQELTRTKETSYSNLNICFFKEQVRVSKHQHLLHLCHLNISPGPKFYHFKDDMYGCSTRRCRVDLGPNGTTQKTEIPMEVAWKLLVGGFNPSQKWVHLPQFSGWTLTKNELPPPRLRI